MEGGGHNLEKKIEGGGGYLKSFEVVGDAIKQIKSLIPVCGRL